MENNNPKFIDQEVVMLLLESVLNHKTRSEEFFEKLVTEYVLKTKLNPNIINTTLKLFIQIPKSIVSNRYLICQFPETYSRSASVVAQFHQNSVLQSAPEGP